MSTEPREPTEIIDSWSLNEAAGELHDARFDENSFHYDESTKEFRMAAWRWDVTAARYRKAFWRLHWRTVPWRRWDLVFREVLACRVQFANNETPCEHYELADLRLRDPHTVEIVTHYALSIRLDVARLSGRLTRSHELSEHDTVRSLVYRPRIPAVQRAQD